MTYLPKPWTKSDPSDTPSLPSVKISDAFGYRREDIQIGFVCRSMVFASIPHSKVKQHFYVRKNGGFILEITGNESGGGVPYGVYPRLILTWIASEVVKTGKREIILGDSLSKFMRNLGLHVSGGRNGTVTNFKKQLQRLFSSHISLTYQDHKTGVWMRSNIDIAVQAQIFWDPKHPDQINLFKSKVLLGETFFNEIKKAPVPVEIEAIVSLKTSSVALDIYFWLTYKMSYLQAPLMLSYEQLHLQFGSGYDHTTNHGRYEFRRKFVLQLKKVLEVYTEARVNITAEGLLLFPSEPHVPRQAKMTVLFEG